jgi:hypothetical protein
MLGQHRKPLAGRSNQYFLVTISDFPKSAGLIYQLDGRYIQCILEFDESGWGMYIRKFGFNQ